METTPNQPRTILSAMQPSGGMTLGNYLGAMKNWAIMSQTDNCYYAVADLHALTVRQNPAELRRNIRNLAAMILACGVNPERATLFIQSQVPEHSVLAWLLTCHTYMGELSRMTQFKDKSAKQENINAGLFTYPSLMAADILLYNANGVPVGADQKQHVELARDIAIRFNNAYGETFAVPEPFIPKYGARIMSLQDPTKKMSKSDENPNAYISMTDDNDTVARKIKRAVTDSDGVIEFDPEHRPGVSNLLTIYAACKGQSAVDAAAEFAGQGYGQLKQAVTDAVQSALAPVQAEYARLLADKEHLNALLRSGAEKASAAGRRTLRKVYRKLGLDM
ncbi:MAG: tryptophan--tRNA ligase [Clostridiales bacterium]|nr:tryptophan--tRNA ligase [Clostridiales bacterium]